MIYILGGHGFVGSAFVRLCQARGIEHVAISREAQKRGHPPFPSCDVLINAAGNSRKPLAREDPLAEFDESVRSVRASLTDFRAGCYVYLSTCDVYADCSSPETTREDLVPDVSRQGTYGFHKYLAEQCVRHAAPRWLIVRLGGMVGPGLKKNAVFDILHDRPLWLDPASELQFLHTDAVSEIVLGLIDAGLEAEIVNVCGRGRIALGDAARLAGRPISVQPGSPLVRYDVSIRKLEAIRPVPETRETLAEYVKDEG